MTWATTIRLDTTKINSAGVAGSEVGGHVVGGGGVEVELRDVGVGEVEG